MFNLTYPYSMALRRTLKLLSQGMERSPRKLLLDAEGRVSLGFSPYQGQLIDCSSQSHGISVLLPNQPFHSVVG